MPIVILAVLLFIACVVVAVSFPSMFEYGCFMTFFIIFIVAILIGGGSLLWISEAYDQKVAFEEYYYTSVISENGLEKHVIKLNDSNELINMDAQFDCVVPDESIIRVYYYDKYSHGINWMNDNIPHYQLITPTSDKYKEINKNVINKIELKADILPRL